MPQQFLNSLVPSRAAIGWTAAVLLQDYGTQECSISVSPHWPGMKQSIQNKTGYSKYCYMHVHRKTLLYLLFTNSYHSIFQTCGLKTINPPQGLKLWPNNVVGPRSESNYYKPLILSHLLYRTPGFSSSVAHKVTICSAMTCSTASLSFVFSRVGL